MYALGDVVLDNQGRVRNLKKDVRHLPNDNDFIKQERAAKTILDEKVQEGLLQVASKCLNPSEVYLDAEEETPTRGIFSPVPRSLALVIDPIDGTLRYLSGDDGFSVCVGLIEDGIVTASLVYFPARKEFYFTKDGHVYCEQRNKSLKRLSAPERKNGLSIYMNSRITGKPAEDLRAQGFRLTDDADGSISWPDGLIGCMQGLYEACIFHTPQIRDILLGAMISKIAGGYACDWQEKPIVWPNGGRISRIAFGFHPKPSELFFCLAGA